MGRSVTIDAIDSGDDGIGNDVTSVIWDDGNCNDVIPEVGNAGNCEKARAEACSCVIARWRGWMWLKLHVKVLIYYLQTQQFL